MIYVGPIISSAERVFDNICLRIQFLLLRVLSVRRVRLGLVNAEKILIDKIEKNNNLLYRAKSSNAMKVWLFDNDDRMNMLLVKSIRSMC